MATSDLNALSSRVDKPLLSLGEILLGIPQLRKQLETLNGQAVVMREGDYKTADGLIFCGACRQPRQTRLGSMVLPAECACDRQRRDMAIFARKQAEMRREKIERLRRECIAADYAALTFDKDDRSDEKTRTVCLRYVERFADMQARNMGLLMYGDTGSGKTFYAACIANALVEQGKMAIIGTTADFIDAMQRNYEADKMQVLRRVEQADLLVLDDVGVEGRNQLTQRLLFELVNARAQARKPLIITSNTITPSAMKTPRTMEEKRLYSRITEMTVSIHVAHPDRRTAIHDDKSAQMRSLLGL